MKLIKKIKKIIKKVKSYFKMIVFATFERICSLLFKMKENKVLFLSDVRNVLDGNLKFIYDALDDEKCEKVLSLKSDRKEKRSMKEKFRLLYNLSTSKYVILDDYSRMIFLMRVRKGQEVCQLWHGPRSL